ncbi:hypothetical protein FSP39_024595 [Pinctada imbricata]|uniref:Uncharacterized protein n=1 Tax=Pinctada imbricata TaxID=66713 RepID=A0AA89C9D6_PINIB|nr:hypothetical protein FSP39_024595 [Pinctada imbricata]
MEVADIGASNVESTTVEEVADIHDIGALNDEGTSVEEVADLGASNDKSNTVEEVADIGALNDEGTSVEEVADIGALNDEGTSVEEVADIGALNDERTTVEEVADIGVSHDEVQIPSPEERENVVTVMLSDNDDEDEAVDDIELLELQTQKTDSDDQYDEQQTDPDLVQDFSNAIPLYNNSNHEDNSAHVTDSEALEQCNVQKLEHNTSQNADQEVNGLALKDCNQMVTGNGVPDLCSPIRLSNPHAVCSNNTHQPVKEQSVSSPANSVHVQGIPETSETKTSSKYVEIKRSLSSESDDIDKISPTNDLVYEWTVDPCKVPDSIESSYSLNTMGSSVDSMFRNSVEPSADVEEEDVDMLVTSSQVLYGGGEAVSIDGSSALGEMEGSSETEAESFTSIKEAKFKYVSNVDLERETSVGQKSSVSTAIEDGQKLDMHVDDSDKGFYAENVNGQVSSFYRGSEGEPKYPANGTKRKLCDDDESNSSAKKPCFEKEERMTRMCTRLSKIVKQYFSIRHFYSREKHRSPAQVKKDLISGLVRNFFKNTQSDFTSRSDKDLVNPKTRQLNLSEDDDVYRQKQDENVGRKKSSLDKTMNDILKSSSEQRSNIDINLNHIHPDSTTMNMDIESKHKTQGKSLKEMAENSSDTSSSNSIQSLHSESLEILDTNYREFRDTVDDSLEITKSGSFRENDRTNLQIIKERDLFVSSRQQEKDESLECNDVNKKCDSDKMKSINKDKDGHQVNPDSSSRTTSKEDGKCGLAGMLSQLQFDSLVQSISRDSQPMVLMEGNVTVVIGIPSASVSHSMINTDEKSFCDAETQASSVDIDMETGVIDPRLISLPSSLETVYSEETASFIKADIIYMDKGYVDLNINQNAQHSSSNRSSQISMEGESHSMECTHDSIETQMHSEETLYKISSTEGNCLSEFVRDSSERDGENLNHGLKKTTNALNMEDNSHNEQTGNASCLSDRRPSSECSHDSCGSNQSMSVLGNIILSYSNTVEDKSRATLPTSKGNESLDLVTTKETKENLNTTKNNEERAVHPGSSSLQDSLQEERDSFGPPIPDSSNDFVQGMSDDDFNGENETTESSIEIYSMSSSPDDSFEVLPHHSKKLIPRSASLILSSSKKDKEREVISGISEGTKDQNNSAGSMESVGKGRQSCSQNKVKTSDMVHEDGSLQSVCTNLKTKHSSRRWSSDSTNPDADDAAGISDSTVHSVNADEKTEDDQTDCKAENGDITLTDEHDDVHTDLNSPTYLNSPNSRSHSRCSLTKNYHYGPGDKTISVSSDEALSDDNDVGSSAITKPLERSNSNELSFDFSQRASQMISKLPEFEEFEDLQTCDIKQETFRRFSDFEDIVISDSSDSDLPEVEFLKYESPKKNFVQQIKNEMLTPKCKTEICDPDLEGQRKTEKKSEPSVSKEAPSSTRKRKKRKSPGKEAEAVKDKKKAQSPRYSEVSKKKKRVKSPKRKMKYMDSDSDVVIISGDSESDTYDLTQSKRCTPVKKEIIYSDNDEFQPLRASQNLPKGKGKRRNAPIPKASPDVKEGEAKSGGKKQKLKRRKKRTSGRNTCKDGERPDRQKPSDNSDSEDDLNMLYFHDVKEGSAKGGYSLEDIFNSESRQSLQGKDGCDDGNNEKDEDDNGMKDDNVDDENQMKDDISEEFSDQNECEEDLVSETQLDNRDQAESDLELPALDVTSPKSPSASQAMSPVIPSFVKATHSLEDESMNELPDPKTRPMKDDDADSESAMDSHEEDVSQKDAKNGIDNTECYQSSGKIPKVYIDRAESIDRSPRTVNAGVPGRNEGQKGEEKCANSATCAMEVIKDRVKEDKVTEDKDAKDQVTASFDDEDDFVSPVIDFTALKSDDESGLDNPANDDILRKGTSKRARDSDSDNDFDVDDYAGHESPSTAGVKATNVDTPKGARDSINSDDDFEPIPSTSFKKRKLFEKSESPAKKPCREIVTLDVEMSTQAVQDISNTQFAAATEQLAEGQGQSPTKKSRARMLIERLKAKRLKGQKEWYKELRLLLKDLTDSEGKIKKGTPDPKSEAGVAFLKIKAVYGRIDTFDVLSRIGLVTRWLDKTRTISSTNPESFRNAINCYIETDDPGAGGQYWPIVKQVRIRLPNCDVCSSGAVLVDLPGVRDSNAARDKIARDYLKKCTVVWVVSSIHRAIDDKTAKDLLGENFRRQLLMDGQYGSIAFICTKADIIKPTEIIRGLKLQKDIQCYEKNLEELTVEQSNLEENINDNKTCLRSMRKEGKQLKKEVEELQEVMAEGDVMDLESQEFIELQEEKEKKDQAVKENQENIEKYEKEMNEAEKRCLQINIDKSKIRKQLSAFCAMKRNEYSKLQIKKDFKAGLREMKRRADMNTTDFDEEDDDDLYNSDEDDKEIGSSADNLKVFCVSAVEYQKMKNLLTNDGPPAVFSSEDETQIPALQQYVHQLTSVRRKHGVERLLQRLAQYVFDINHYLVEDGTESKSARRHMKNAIKLHSNGLMEKFDPVMQKLMSDLNEAFCGQINPKMYEGVAAANGAANNIVAKWGSKGVFTSPSFGQVNFNEDLSAPMYTCLSIVWDKVFSGILWNHLERCKIILIHTLKSFVDGLCKELLALGVSDTRTSRVTQQIIDSSTHKVSFVVLQIFIPCP